MTQSTENSPLGTFLKGFIDVPTCHVGESLEQCVFKRKLGTLLFRDMRYVHMIGEAKIRQ